MTSNNRYKKRVSDRSGFDYLERELIRDNGILVGPDEYDTPPPSDKPLEGGVSLSEYCRADYDSYGIDSSQVTQVQYISENKPITFSKEYDKSGQFNPNSMQVYICGSNNDIYNYDLFDDSTKLLLHFEDSSYTDNSQYAHTVTAISDTTIDNTNYKLGSGSLLLTKTDDCLSIANSGNEWYFLEKDFTIESWVKFNGTYSIFNSRVFASQYLDSKNYWQFKSTLYSRPNLYYVKDNKLILNYTDSNIAFPYGQWFHVALVRSSNEILFFYNGVKSIMDETTGSKIEDADLSTTIFENSPLRIGASYNPNTGTYGFNGNLDEYRISVGTARYVNNFEGAVTQEFVNLQTSCNAQIQSGEEGDKLTICGVGSGVWLRDGNGLSMQKPFLVDSGAIITFYYTTGAGVWHETSRSHLTKAIGGF